MTDFAIPGMMPATTPKSTARVTTNDAGQFTLPIHVALLAAPIPIILVRATKADGYARAALLATRTNTTDELVALEHLMNQHVLTGGGGTEGDPTWIFSGRWFNALKADTTYLDAVVADAQGVSTSELFAEIGADAALDTTALEAGTLAVQTVVDATNRTFHLLGNTSLQDWELSILVFDPTGKSLLHSETRTVSLATGAT